MKRLLYILMVVVLIFSALTVSVMLLGVVRMQTNTQKQRFFGCIPPGVVAPRFVTFTAPDGTPPLWNHKPVTYAFDQNTPDYAKTSFASCFQQWEQASNNLLEFSERVNGADINIVWDTTGKTITDPYLGYTTFTLSGDAIISAIIRINAYTFDWHSGNPRGVSVAGADGKRNADIDGVALHEIGHSLGLSHSDNDPSKIVDPGDGTPTMNSVIYPGAEKLHPDDVAGLLRIYSGAAFVLPNDFQKVDAALTDTRVQHSVVGLTKIPKPLKGRALKAMIIGDTYLYFDATTGEYLGQLSRNRYLPK